MTDLYVVVIILVVACTTALVLWRIKRLTAQRDSLDWCLEDARATLKRVETQRDRAIHLAQDRGITAREALSKLDGAKARLDRWDRMEGQSAVLTYLLLRLQSVASPGDPAADRLPIVLDALGIAGGTAALTDLQKELPKFLGHDVANNVERLLTGEVWDPFAGRSTVGGARGR